MARYTASFLGKKRGERRTSSSSSGVVGMTLFSLIFTAVGGVTLVLMLKLLVIPEWRANHDYLQATCRVLDKRIGEMKDDDGDLNYRPEIQVSYEAAGEQHQTWTYDATGVYTTDRDRSEEILDQYAVGQEYPCWYDPRAPHKAVLVRGYTLFAWIMLALPLIFLAIGAGGLVWSVRNWGKSAERQAAAAQAGREMFAGGVPRLANVPSDTLVTNSPGTRLRYRLPSESPGWQLVVITFFAVVWNGMVAFFLTMFFSDFNQEGASWLLAAFFVPFVIVGLVLIFMTVRALMVWLGVGQTIVEISQHPLFPGGRYELYLSQAGRLHVNSLSLWLVCDEECTYRQGTDTRTSTERVEELQLYQREAFDIASGLPFETRCEFEVPPGAMHSFEAPHNNIKWKLEVRGDIAGWPDFQRGYSVHVYPPLGEPAS